MGGINLDTLIFQTFGYMGQKIPSLMPNARPHDGQHDPIRLRLQGDVGEEAAVILLIKYGHLVRNYNLREGEAQDRFFTGGKFTWVLTLNFGDPDLNRTVLNEYNGLWNDDGSLKTSALKALPTTFRANRPTYASLISALKGGRVRDDKTRHFIREPQFRILTKWNVPVYDFGGGLFNIEDDYFGEELIKPLLEAAIELVDDDDLRFCLPAPKCAFMMTMGGTEVCIHTELNGERLTMAPFHNRPKNNEWVRVFETTFNRFEKPPEDAKREFSVVLARACGLLKAWEADAQILFVEERSNEERDAINTVRKTRDEPLIPTVRVIHLSEHKIVRRAIGRIKTARAFHEKGRHERTLCDREIVRIRNGKEERYTLKKAGQRITVNPDKAPAVSGQAVRSVPLMPSYTEVRA